MTTPSDTAINDDHQQLARAIADSANAPTTPEDNGAGSGSDDDGCLYANIDEWVQDWLAPNLERRIANLSLPGLHWCPIWWKHPDARNRIYALWREWEKARQADNMSLWFRDHLDHHLRELCGENGPFRRCMPGKHTPAVLLDVEPVPHEVLALFPEGIPDF